MQACWHEATEPSRLANTVQLWSPVRLCSLLWPPSGCSYSDRAPSSKFDVYLKILTARTFSLTATVPPAPYRIRPTIELALRPPATAAPHAEPPAQRPRAMRVPHRPGHQSPRALHNRQSQLPRVQEGDRLRSLEGEVVGVTRHWCRNSSYPCCTVLSLVVPHNRIINHRDRSGKIINHHQIVHQIAYYIQSNEHPPQGVSGVWGLRLQVSCLRVLASPRSYCGKPTAHGIELCEPQHVLQLQVVKCRQSDRTKLGASSCSP